MERTYIKDITPGMRRVSGFVENFRNKRTMAFIVVKDITGKLQVTVEKEKHPEFEEMLNALTIHSVVTFEGEVVASEYVKLGGKEMYPTAMTGGNRILFSAGNGACSDHGSYRYSV